jgi:hypothetical protein
LPKTDTFYGICKKDKNCHVKCPIFSIKFYLCYTRHIKRRFIVQRLYEHVAHKDVCVDFLFQFFDISKYVKYVSQNIGSISSQEPNHHSRPNCPSIHSLVFADDLIISGKANIQESLNNTQTLDYF